jgi:hypothetical protein
MSALKRFREDPSSSSAAAVVEQGLVIHVKIFTGKTITMHVNSGDRIAVRSSVVLDATVWGMRF